MLLVSCTYTSGFIVLRMWFKQYNRYQIFTVLIFVLYNGCGAISKANFNEQIRDYSVINNNVNLTDVRTLQKANIGLEHYASYAPLHNTIRFKEVPDNVLSGSSHGRGLLHHDYSGYGQLEYEEPHYGYEYQHDLSHSDPHYNHYDFHHGHHQPGHHVGGYGHHHKHFDPTALLSKTLLWPIAGIAFLGAAAALVSNPVLLQLGVVSGRKKRQIENLGFVQNSINKWSPKPDIDDGDKFQSVPSFVVKRRFIQKGDVQARPTVETKDKLEHKSNFKILTVLSRRYTDEDEEKMVQVPLKFRDP